MKYILFLLLFPCLLFAQDGKPVPKHIAQIKLFRGDVFKQKGGILLPVTKGMRFNKEDTIVTHDKSFAQLQVVDDTIINISGNSELNFAEFKFVDKNNREGTFQLIKGQVRALVKNKAPKPDALLFKTKHAVMGVRGTELLVNSHTHINREVSEFALIEGIASVADENNQMVEIKKQDRIIIVRDPNTGKTENKSFPLSYGMLDHLTKNSEEFLSPFNPETGTSDDPYASLQPPREEVKAEVVQEDSHEEEEVEGVDQKLKRLNEKLKSYQRKR